MAGLMSHVFFALGGLLLLMLISDWKYGFGFFLGQLVPDAIKFGIPAIRLKTISFGEMMTDPLYLPLNFYTHGIYTWVVLLVLMVGFGWLFYRFGDFNWDKFKVWAIANLFFFVSVMIHLVFDFYIVEDSFWI